MRSVFGWAANAKPQSSTHAAESHRSVQFNSFHRDLRQRLLQERMGVLLGHAAAVRELGATRRPCAGQVAKPVACLLGLNDICLALLAMCLATSSAIPIHHHVDSG